MVCDFKVVSFLKLRINEWNDHPQKAGKGKYNAQYVEEETQPNPQIKMRRPEY
jgi:hypothetical protein